MTNPATLAALALATALAVCLAYCIQRLRRVQRDVIRLRDAPPPPQASADDMRQEAQQSRLLYQLATVMRHEGSSDQVLQKAAEILGIHFDACCCLIRQFQGDVTRARPVIARYTRPGLPVYRGSLDDQISDLAADLVREIYREDKAVAVSDIATDPRLSRCRDLLEQFSVKSMIFIRTSCEGAPNGSITLIQTDRIRAWPPEETGLIEAAAIQVGIAFAQSNLHEQEQSRIAAMERQNLALQAAKHEAEAANLAKTRFLANMSHELRTPLNAILGFAQVLQRDEDVKPAHREPIAIINQSGEHLLDLINDVLEMSKIEAGHIELESERIDTWELLSTLEHMLVTRARTRNLILEFDVSKDLPRFVRGDKKKLRQVLINLLGNAIKFTGQGRIDLRAQVDTTDPEEEQLVIEITDTGPGIPPDDVEHLFDAFFQSSRGKDKPVGTGLGLPISQEYVRLMGGDLTVQTEVDKGSTFAFHIPLHRMRAQEADGDGADAVKAYTLSDSAGRPRVLVVDDDGDNQLLLCTLLKKAGFDVHTASNGEEALTAWRAWQPVLILMDLRMPGLDGRETTRIIRAEQSDASPPTRIIALTADVMKETPTEVMAAGCDDFITKPYRNQDLLEAIGRHMELSYTTTPVESPALFSSPSDRDDARLTKTLKALNREQLVQFKQALLRLDTKQIDTVLDTLQSTDPSAFEVLHQYTGAYEYDRILACIPSPEAASGSG